MIAYFAIPYPVLPPLAGEGAEGGWGFAINARNTIYQNVHYPFAVYMALNSIFIYTTYYMVLYYSRQLFKKHQHHKFRSITMNYKKNCVVICGPTASGKTHLAVRLSLLFNGEIISADSRQVYRGMNIGTGKDLDEYSTDRGNVIVHLIDIRDPVEVYTLYHFKQDFFATFDKIHSRDHLPFLTGGTGLYIESVLRNFEIPQIPENVEFRKQYMAKEKGELIEQLRNRSPELLARTDLSSKKRIVRAIEIALSSPVDSTPENQPIPSTTLNPVVLCTRWDRPTLYQRIDRRLSERIDQGMIDEVKNLLDSGVPESRLIQFGMEYKHIVHYLKSLVSLEEMLSLLKTDIHHLAKRQETWFRGMERRGIPVIWIDNADYNIAAEVLKRELLTEPA